MNSPGLQSCYLGHHHQKERIGGNVKGNTQEDIGTSLVELAGEFPIGHIELEQNVTGGKCHLVQFTHVPGTDNMPSGIGIIPDGINHAAIWSTWLPSGVGQLLHWYP